MTVGCHGRPPGRPAKNDQKPWKTKVHETGPGKSSWYKTRMDRNLSPPGNCSDHQIKSLFFFVFLYFRTKILPNFSKKVEKSYHLRVDQSIPWFTTQSHSIEMTDWLRHSKNPTKYYGRITKTLQALEEMWNSGSSFLKHQNWSIWGKIRLEEQNTPIAVLKLRGIFDFSTS